MKKSVVLSYNFDMVSMCVKSYANPSRFLEPGAKQRETRRPKFERKSGGVKNHNVSPQK